MENIKYNDIDVKIDYENKSVWISQDNISKLFGLSKSTTSFHLKKIVDKDIKLIHSTVRKIRTVKNGKTYLLNYYNLQIIKFLCYKINPSIASEFIKWVNIQFEENEPKALNLEQKTYEIVTFIDNELQIDVNVDVEKDTVWLTQEQISMLYVKSLSTINEHIKNILSDELLENEVVRKFGKTEFSNKNKLKYNLDMIIAIGYRVNSKRGIMFRKWATSILKNHLTKGYSINEKISN